jgi:hypothetical protein
MIVEFFGDRYIERFRDIKQLEEYLAEKICNEKVGDIANIIGTNLLKTYQECFKGRYFVEISLKTCISNEYRELRLWQRKKTGCDLFGAVREFGTLLYEVPDTGSAIHWLKNGPSSMNF